VIGSTHKPATQTVALALKNGSQGKLSVSPEMHATKSEPHSRLPTLAAQVTNWQKADFATVFTDNCLSDFAN